MAIYRGTGTVVDSTEVLTNVDILDEDTMESNRADALATQQSIKAYVDTSISYEALDDNGDVGTNAGQLAIGNHQHTGADVILSEIGSPSYSTIQKHLDAFHSSGVAEGFTLTDGGSGTVNVAAGSGFIRATDSDVAEIKAFDLSASTGNALTNNEINYVYIAYNAGVPLLTIATIKPTDYHTNVLLGNVYRNGTVLHINGYRATIVTDHASKMVQRMLATQPMQHESGAAISETGTRNIAITAGTFWEGYTSLTTPAMDSSVTDTFSYFYKDGVGGWTEVTSSTQISNTQYDDGSGILAALGVNRYGVHWVYLGTDGDVYILYGYGSYTIAQATEAAQPSALPPHIESHGRLIGKIIIQESAAVFTSVASSFDTTFQTSGVTDHEDLSSIGTNTHAQIDSHIASHNHSALTGDVVFDQNNDAVTPTIAFGDGDTGFYEESDDILVLATGGAKRVEFGAGAGFWAAKGAFSTSWGLYHGVASATAPSLIPTASDPNTGIGRVSADNLSLIAGGLEGVRVEDPADLVAGETSLWVYDDDNNAIEQVTVGAANSGGSGFKVLRIPN